MVAPRPDLARGVFNFDKNDLAQALVLDFGVAWRGVAWRGLAWPGLARRPAHGEARRGAAWGGDTNALPLRLRGSRHVRWGENACMHVQHAQVPMMEREP